MNSVSASLPNSASVNVSVVVKRDQNCRAINDSTSEPCGETEGLRILDEFRRLYERRIEKIDREPRGDESDRVCMKLQIMNDWIKDLGEQNTMLVHTVEDLEQAACSRVKLLEEKLKQSSQVVADNLTRSIYSEEALNNLSNRVSQLQKDEEYLQKKIEYLQSDIRGLLELIRRAHWQNVWSLKGITFFEIQPEDIPVPLDCACGQEQTDSEQIKSLNSQIEQLQENEKKMIRSQLKLERKIEDLTTELSLKDETIKKYVSRLQCFCDKLKEHAKQTNHLINHPLTITSGTDCDIILTPDILESVLIAKDTENQSLYRQLQDVESKLMICTYENNTDMNNLRVQLEEKCKRMQQLEDQIAHLGKEATNTRDALTTEIVTLTEQNHHADLRNSLKNDLIKEMCKELKQVTQEDTPPQKVCIDTTNLPEKCPLFSEDAPHHSKKNELISFLNSTKTHIQKECEILSDLKLEMKKFIEKLTIKDNEMNIISNSCTDEIEFCTGDISDKIVNCIEIITRMYSEREREITLFDCMIKKEESHCVCSNSKSIKSNTNSTRQFKLMEEFRVCTVEVQAATEDIREEISTVASTLNSRHQNYEELSKLVVNMQNYLARTREGLIETINRLELQEEEKLRHSERITNGKLKLKDIKNEINHVQSELSCWINDMQENIQEYSKSGYTGVCVSSDLLTTVTEEVEKILTNLQLFQTNVKEINRGSCMTSILKGLKSQLCAIDCSLKDLQQRADEVLSNDEVAKAVFCERQSRLIKLEKEVDCAHTKMQDVLETFLSIKQEGKEEFSHGALDNQEVLDIIKAKKELHKLKKEYDDLKLNMVQQAYQTKYDEKLNKWKNRVTELEDQIKVLQHEAKCKQEANNFLKNSIQSMEKELIAVQSKAEDYRHCHNKDSIELQNKIIELENIIKMQKEIEGYLRRSLNHETNVKKSTKTPNAFQNECVMEATFLRCDYPSKHENISYSFKAVQDAVQSAKLIVHNFESELKRLVCKESSQSCLSAKFVIMLTETLGKCREELDTCSQELSKLKSAVCSKEKLLENMEEIMRIQRDSLAISQTEVKELHQKLQEKIDKQSFIITQYEKEKNELLKQNELQIQTIGHLQDAVVEAKRNLDQMGHKVMSDLSERDDIIRRLRMYVDETQEQYNECFTEASNQDLLLDLQRDAIDSLHKRIRCLEYDKHLIATTLHTIYYSILSAVQEQVHGYVKDFRELKSKMNSFAQARDCCKCKYTRETSNCTEQQLEKLNDAYSCARHLESASCSIYDSKHSSNNYITLVEEHSEMEDIVEEIKRKDKNVKDIECDLKCENQQLKIDLQHRTLEIENLTRKLEHIKQKETEYKTFLLKLEAIEREVKTLNSEIINKEEIIKDQSHELKTLRKRLLARDQPAEEDLIELNESEMLNILCDRVHFLKTLLQEKSDNMVKLEADYELLKNENSILKKQNNIFEDRAKVDISQLKEKLKETRLKLRQMEEDYQRITEDFNETQQQLLLATKREADSQESLIILEKNYCSKIVNIQNEATSLRDLTNKLSKELEETRGKLSSKNIELSQAQDKCKCYIDQLDTIRQNWKTQKEKLTKVENVNCSLIQQLQEYMEENNHLSQQKISLEEDNSIFISELQHMLKSLLELKECHLKDQSLIHMSSDLIEVAVSRSELCKKTKYVVSCIRDCIEQQKRYSEILAKNLENKQQHLMQLAFEKKVLLIKIRKLKRINLLAQKRTHRQLTGRSLKKAYVSDYISTPDVTYNTGTDSVSSPIYANLREKCFAELVRTNRCTSTRGNLWWFPKMEYLVNEIRKSNQWWSRNFNNETESDTSLEGSRDYGYQSSTSK